MKKGHPPDPYPTDPRTALVMFANSMMDAYSAAYNDWTDPANKNRLAAVSAIRLTVGETLDPATGAGHFRLAQRRLLVALERMEASFDPPFDSEYGTGKGVFGTFMGEMESLHGVEDCWPIRYEVVVYTKAGGKRERAESFRLAAVDQEAFKALFDPSGAAEILTGKFAVLPAHMPLLDSYIPLAPGLKVKLSSALKKIHWNFEAHTYRLESYVYDPGV